MTRDIAIGISAGASVLAAAFLGGHSHIAFLASSLVVAITIGALVHYDLHARRIPNRIVLPATAACAAIDALERLAAGAFLTAAGITALLASIALIRPTALGMGDAKLALLVTAAFPNEAVAALLLGLGLAALGGIVIARHRREPIRHTSIPLAPFIAVATMLALL